MDFVLTSCEGWEEVNRVEAAFLAFLEGLTSVVADSGISGLFLLDIG